MGQSNTLLYVVLAIVILHFIIGFGFLAYKLLGPVKKSEIKRVADTGKEQEDNKQGV